MPTVAELVQSLPEGGSKVMIDDAATRKTIAELAALGPKGVAEVLGLLVDSKPEEDTRARYALHNLATYAMRPEATKDRAAFAEALAAALGGDRPKEIQAFVLRQIQLCGGAEVVPALGKLLADPELGDPACAALVAIRTGAADQLRAALPKAEGRMKLVLVQNLGVLRDEKSAALLRDAAKSEDAELKLAALQALGAVGAGEDSALLLDSAAKAEGYSRAKATDACFTLAERLIAAGKKEAGGAILEKLYASRTEPSDKHVRSAAERALKSLGAT